MKRRGLLCAAAVALAALAAAVRWAAPAASGPAPGPNVVMIMTDDENAADMRVMPRTRRLIGASGATFRNSFASLPMCCPSRATFLTGRYAHNHHVFSQTPPLGGYRRLDAHNTLAVWLRSAGYHTIQIGKYLNGYGAKRPYEVPPGWSEWRGSIDPTTYRYWGYTLNENGRLNTYGRPEVENPRLYQTDVYARKAVRAIHRRAGKGPFFINLAFTSPHTEAGGVKDPGPRPAPRDAGRFADLPLPHPASFNEPDVGDKPRFMRVAPLGPGQINAVTRRYRHRLEALVDVDRAVAAVVAALRDTGQLSGTFVFVTSDNGLFHAEHRIKANKFFAYDPATRVPLLLRGPGVPHGIVSDELVANVDLAPTIVEATGATATKIMDGRSLLRFARDPGLRTRRPILHEALTPLRLPDGRIRAPRYRAIRTRRWLLVRWSNGARELYDLKHDPGELHSLAANPRYDGVQSKLAADLDRLADCRGAACRYGAKPVPAP